MHHKMCDVFSTILVAGVLYSGCLSPEPALAQNTQCSDRPTTDSSNACANTRFVQAHVNAVVIPISAYGAKCDDSTDDTLAIQNAWNAAALVGANVWLGGIGTGVCKISSLTMPTPTGTGKASFLTGPGSGSVKLSSTVIGTTCAITASATYGVNSYVEGAFQGFELEQRSHTQTGYGFCISNWTKGTWHDVKLSWFFRGFSGIDTTSIVFLNSTFFDNQIGAYGAMSTNSPPNDWAFISNKFQNNGKNAISLTRPNLANISFNEFQNTGYNAGQAPTGTIDIIGPPGGPVVGANIINNYFEGNDGSAEIRLNQNSIVDGVAVYNINNNTITRTQSTQAAGVLVLNTGTGTSKTTVNFGGNGLYDNTGVAGGFLWISASTPATTNYLFNCSLSNRADIAVEMPTVCRNNVANTVPMVDANAQYIGYGTQTQLTALINPATTALSGAVPAWPNDATKFFNGAGAYSVPTASGIAGGAALTKTDDTNVTLTLGGAPTTALLNAASITAGWTGTLAASRGGTGLSSLGTGVATALGTNVGSAGAFVTFNGASGTPSSLTLTNATGLPTGGMLDAAVTYAKIQNVAGLSVFGRSAATTGVGGAITAVDVSQILRVDTAGNTIGFGSINLAASQAVGSSLLPLANGGLNAALTASNGGIFYSTASAGAILSGTATARQMLQSGASTTPAWSTTTWPATTTINRLLYSSAANVISDLATANSSILVTDSGGIPSLSTTLPAHTLGGTISGGGNQINNVIIGNTTPLAGSFTTLSASTSITSPIHNGGSGAASTLTLASTSGAGTTDATIFTTASQVERARITTGGLFNIGPAVAPDALLTLNANTVATAVSASPYNMHIIGANSANPGVMSDAFAGQNLYTARVAFGTAASPTQVASSSIMLGFTGQALDNTATYRSSVVFELGTIGAITSTDGGGFFRVRTMAAGTTTLAERFRVQSGMSIGDTTDPGIGGLRATGATIQFTALASDTATVDNTVCVSSTGTLLKGSGALGVCLGTSSARFKHDIVSMGAGLAEIVKLSPKNFFYNKGYGDDGKRQQYGFIAEEVAKVFPGVTAPDKDGKPQSVDMLAMVPVLVKAVQELKVANDNLAAEVRTLKAAGGKK